MRPWGGTPILLKHHRDHALIKLVEIVSVTLAIASALGLFFSEKLTGHGEIRGHCVNANIKPEFGTRWLYDVEVSSMDGSNTARGRLSIIKGLTRHKHILFDLGCQSRLAGNQSNVIAHSVMPACVKPLVA